MKATAVHIMSTGSGWSSAWQNQRTQAYNVQYSVDASKYLYQTRFLQHPDSIGGHAFYRGGLCQSQSCSDASG